MAFRGVLPPRKPFFTKRRVGTWELLGVFFTEERRIQGLGWMVCWGIPGVKGE